jgi:hypothetical protein
MSSTVEDVKRRGNKAWISHFAGKDINLASFF